MQNDLQTKKTFSKWTLSGVFVSIIACPLVYTLILSLNVGADNQFNKIENNYAYNFSFILNVVSIFLLGMGLNDIKKNKNIGTTLSGISIILVIINFLMTITMSFWNF
ncbi:MAG: hypothetical protein QG603_210 [Patescibacteria group bacterium]|jgi:ABC-type transport system involved in multi-copper enzyme maturation permease subunit|nr:hypothetical protein [Patescibacteria group bacterium]MDQ5970433.1 hypothetical protein [Patescibacteria group bacterium]